MCVAQTNSYQDETLAIIRKAQSRGLQVLNIEYDDRVLATEGRWIIESVTIVGKNGPFSVPCISAREYIGKWTRQKDYNACH